MLAAQANLYPNYHPTINYKFYKEGKAYNQRNGMNVKPAHII